MSPIPSLRAKRDLNEPEVMAAFQCEGFGVVQNSARGVWDLFVWDRRDTDPVRAWAYVEVKRQGGKLTPDQEAWAKRHPDLPKYIARSGDDARAIATQLRLRVPQFDTPAEWRKEGA